jgi:hypothetical protein
MVVIIITVVCAPISKRFLRRRRQGKDCVRIRVSVNVSVSVVLVVSVSMAFAIMLVLVFQRVPHGSDVRKKYCSV